MCTFKVLSSAEFSLGANDYITKPFNNDELIARVKVQLRDNNTFSNILKFKDIELDKNNFSVKCNGKKVSFTKKEFELLKLIIENQHYHYEPIVLLFQNTHSLH